MTREQFADRYATRSKMSVEILLEYGMVFVRCQCGADNCQGWQATLRDVAEVDPNVTAAELNEAIQWGQLRLTSCPPDRPTS